MQRLTEIQRGVFDFVVWHMDTKGSCPSYRDIAARFGWASPNAAGDHLKRLEKKGYIKLQSGKSRAIIVMQHDDGPANYCDRPGRWPDFIQTQCGADMRRVIWDRYDNAIA